MCHLRSSRLPHAVDAKPQRRRRARNVPDDPVLQSLKRHLLGQRLELYIGVHGLVGDGGPHYRTLRDQAVSQRRKQRLPIIISIRVHQQRFRIPHGPLRTDPVPPIRVGLLQEHMTAPPITWMFSGEVMLLQKTRFIATAGGPGRPRDVGRYLRLARREEWRGRVPEASGDADDGHARVRRRDEDARRRGEREGVGLVPFRSFSLRRQREGAVHVGYGAAPFNPARRRLQRLPLSVRRPTGVGALR